MQKESSQHAQQVSELDKHSLAQWLGHDVSNIPPRSLTNLASHKASCTPKQSEINSASTVESATTLCSLLDQVNAALHIQPIYEKPSLRTTTLYYLNLAIMSYLMTLRHLTYSYVCNRKGVTFPAQYMRQTRRLIPPNEINRPKSRNCTFTDRETFDSDQKTAIHGVPIAEPYPTRFHICEQFLRFTEPQEAGKTSQWKPKFTKVLLKHVQTKEQAKEHILSS
jgi:hypothetical protein